MVQRVPCQSINYLLGAFFLAVPLPLRERDDCCPFFVLLSYPLLLLLLLVELLLLLESLSLSLPSSESLLLDPLLLAEPLFRLSLSLSLKNNWR